MNQYADQFDFEFYRLMCGDLPADHVMQIGTVPPEIFWKFGWAAKSVYLSCADAKKIRFHPDHGMDIETARMIVPTVTDGDYYSHNRGGALQIEVVLHNHLRPKECHFLALARDELDKAFHIRTFFRTTKMSRSKFKGGERIRIRSAHEYFKDVK